MEWAIIVWLLCERAERESKERMRETERLSRETERAYTELMSDPSLTSQEKGAIICAASQIAAVAACI
jgi:hypothetical protein